MCAEGVWRWGEGSNKKSDTLFSVKNQNKNNLNNSTHDADKSYISIYIYIYADRR